MSPILIGATLIGIILFQSAPANAQDIAALQKLAKVEIIHYQVVGELSQKHVQIPPTDADLYADVFERLTLSFDWDKKKGVIVGTPTIQNDAAKVSNLMGMDKKCPPGKLNGQYEHFDVVEIRQSKPKEALELIGKRIHPDTMVADSCSSKLRLFKGATVAAKEYIGLPDLQALAMVSMLPQGGNIALTPDGKSIVMKALNDNWVWTYTPTAK